MRNGVGSFNKAARQEYLALPENEQERLKKLSAERVEGEVEMTSSEIMKAGAKAFKKIHKQVHACSGILWIILPMHARLKDPCI